MIFFTSLILGMAFASAGLIAKQINSLPGMQIANRRIHVYLTLLGRLSNLVLPVAVIIVAATVQGAGGAGLTALGLIMGAVILGMLRLPYPFRLLIAVLGVPVAAMLFLVCLAM